MDSPDDDDDADGVEAAAVPAPDSTDDSVADSVFDAVRDAGVAP
jgi:hypothetical protein